MLVLPWPWPPPLIVRVMLAFFMTPSSPPNPVPGWDTLFNAMEPEFPNLVLQQNNLGSVCVCARTHIHTYIM